MCLLERNNRFREKRFWSRDAQLFGTNLTVEVCTARLGSDHPYDVLSVDYVGQYYTG
jgi:hypothetical protein